MIRFDDGAAYERSMGLWSRLAGEVFLDWLAPPPGLAWVDVGCGNGAFTELIMQRCAPAAVDGIDPSEGQLAFARARSGAAGARFHQGDAMALPFADRSRDAATMALVIFFVPDAAGAVAEMARVVRPGGIVSTYVWDFANGGFPWGVVQEEVRAVGGAPLLPPGLGVERLEALRDIWAGAGLCDLVTCEITVQRRFADVADFWDSVACNTSLRPTMATLPPDRIALMKRRVEARVRIEADGTVVHTAKANAIRGCVPG